MSVIFHCLLLCVVGAAAESLQNVTVTVKYGTLLGRRQRHTYDIGSGAVTDTVDVFLGVPYAAPPINHLRFKAPQPPAQWQGVRDATLPGAVCPQKVYYTQTDEQHQSEDCLYLNIYSPLIEASSDIALPVMVFIHGGSYEEGAGSRYDGFTLAQHGVVVVTINYRLGLLGFLTNGGDSLPGNYGILDQIESLRWVSDNIGQFHGDPCKVTLFGSSAGSASIGVLMLSSLATGLFHRVILQSGSPIASWAVYNHTVDHHQFFNDVSMLVGCREGSAEEKIECLRGLHHSNFTHYHWDKSNCSNDLDAAINRLLNPKTFPRIVPSKLNFKPRVDGEVLPNRPRNMFLSGLYHNVTVMIGTLEDEWARSMGWFFNDMEHAETELDDGFKRDSFKRSIYHVIRTRFSWPREVADAALFIYTDWENVTDPYMNREGFKDLMSDMLMVAPSVDFADILTKQGTTVYYYNYNHSSVFTEPTWWKCYHSLELDSVFGSPFTGYNIAVDGRRNHTEADKEISRVVMALWTNFAKYGNPTKDPVEQLTWTPLDPSTNNYLQIETNNTEMRSRIRAEKMAFWNTLVPSLRGVNPLFDVIKAKPADLHLTLAMFFGILASLSFLVMLGLVVKTAQLQKKLDKIEAVTAEPV